MIKRKKAFFSISAVAKMFSIHQQTIRLYEKEGLLTPKRSEGNTRLFSEEDLDRLEEIIHLTHTVGINLAGVEMILKLQKKVDKLQEQINELFHATNQELLAETERKKYATKESLERLTSLKERTSKKALPKPKENRHVEESN